MVSAVQWARDVLAGLGDPDTVGSEELLVAWARGEGTRAANNPLASTSPGPAGTTNFNSFGPGGKYHVRNYPDYAAGIERTVHGIELSNYPHIQAALAAGDPSIALAAPGEFDVWGTGGAHVQSLFRDTAANWSKWAGWSLPAFGGATSRSSGGSGNVAAGASGQALSPSDIGGFVAGGINAAANPLGWFANTTKAYVIKALIFGGILMGGVALVLAGAYRATGTRERVEQARQAIPQAVAAGAI